MGYWGSSRYRYAMLVRPSMSTFEALSIVDVSSLVSPSAGSPPGPDRLSAAGPDRPSIPALSFAHAVLLLSTRTTSLQSISAPSLSTMSITDDGNIITLSTQVSPTLS
jgi:hypothetical protein